MTSETTVFTDTILHEFQGDLSETVAELGQLLRGFRKSYPQPDDPWWDSQHALEEYQLIAQRLHERAPEGYYFGGHPTEPQCLGYWLNH